MTEKAILDASSKLGEAVIKSSMDDALEHLAMVVCVLKSTPASIGDGTELRHGIERLTKATEVIQDLYLGTGERI